MHRAGDRLRRLQPGRGQVTFHDPPADGVAAHVWDADRLSAQPASHLVAEHIWAPLAESRTGPESGDDLVPGLVEDLAGHVLVPGPCRVGTANLDGENLGESLVHDPLGEVERSLDVGCADVVRELVHGAGADPGFVVLGRPRDHPDGAGRGPHAVIAERVLQENRIVGVAECEADLDAVRVVDAGKRDALVLPGTRKVACDLTPRIGLDEARDRLRVAGIVDLDPKAVAALVDLLEHLHTGGVERRDASHRGQGVEPRGYRLLEQPQERLAIVMDGKLDLVVGAQRHLMFTER